MSKVTSSGNNHSGIHNFSLHMFRNNHTYHIDIVTKTFFSRVCRILFSNFSPTWIRDALDVVPCYNWQNYHVPMPAWLTEGQRDDVRTPPKSQQLHTDWTAHFSVGGRPPARILGPGSTEDCNSWSKMITIVLICAWHILICVSLNQRCLADLMRRRNDGAGYDNLDAEFPLTQSDEEQVSVRNRRGSASLQNTSL